jgi:predicted O-methyltransferase YrrM
MNRPVPSAWLEVEGWLSDKEGEALQRLAAGGTVVELGSYKGRSTIAMAASAAQVVSVDHHHGDVNTGPTDTLLDFLENINKHGAADIVLALIEPIDEAATLLKRCHFDGCFIDAEHTAESVERDTRLALAVVRPGGWIAWHDWNDTGVRSGVHLVGLSPTVLADTLAVYYLPGA